MIVAIDPRARSALCSSCGRPFTSVLSKQGRWSRTCSPPCRLAALDRMLSVFQAARAKLAAEIERGHR